MRKGKTANVAEKANVLIVKGNPTKDKVFKTDENDTIVENVEEIKAEEKPQEQPQPVETVPQITTTDPITKEEKQEIVKTEAKREPTLQEFKDRATILYLLQEKHTGLIDKRNRLDRFQISHDNQNAEIIVKDANGLEFKSTSAKTIGQFLDFCKAEFSEVITETEANLMKAFAIQ